MNNDVKLVNSTKLNHKISTPIAFVKCVKDLEMRVLMEQVLNALKKHYILVKHGKSLCSKLYLRSPYVYLDIIHERLQETIREECLKILQYNSRRNLQEKHTCRVSNYATNAKSSIRRVCPLRRGVVVEGREAREECLKHGTSS